jgi:hypothetical protein
MSDVFFVNITNLNLEKNKKPNYGSLTDCVVIIKVAFKITDYNSLLCCLRGTNQAYPI